VDREFRLIDARSIYTGQSFKGISYALPYISSFGGGVDFIPRVGDRCLVLATDQGRFGSGGRWAMCIGFRNGFGAQPQARQAMDEGAVCIRSVDEQGNDAYVVCHTGGTVLIGSGQAAKTVYSPLNSTIAHLFDNWESRGSGGHVLWNRAQGSGETTLDIECRTRSNPDDTGARIRVQVGIDEENPVVIEVVNEKSADAGTPPMRVRVSADGQMWLEGESINIVGRAAVSIDAPTLNIKNRPVLTGGDPI
jgi:hypothetical protein